MAGVRDQVDEDLLQLRAHAEDRGGLVRERALHRRLGIPEHVLAEAERLIDDRLDGEDLGGAHVRPRIRREVLREPLDALGVVDDASELLELVLGAPSRVS